MTSIFRPGVADDFDALDVGARTFNDVVRDVERAVAFIALDVGVDLREDEALARRSKGQPLHCGIHAASVIDVADARPHRLLQIFRIEIGIAHVHGDIGNLVFGTFLDRVGDIEVLAIRRKHGIRADHTHIGEAVAQIVPPQQLLVVLQPIWIVCIVTREEFPPPRFLGTRQHPSDRRR